MIRASTDSRLGVDIQKSNQYALQVVFTTPLKIIGETHFDVTRDNVTLHIEALVVKDLDVEFFGEIPFMSSNDISICPVKHEIMVGDSHTINYNTYSPRHQVSVSCLTLPKRGHNQLPPYQLHSNSVKVDPDPILFFLFFFYIFEYGQANKQFHPQTHSHIHTRTLWINKKIGN